MHQKDVTMSGFLSSVSNSLKVQNTIAIIPVITFSAPHVQKPSLSLALHAVLLLWSGSHSLLIYSATT